MASRRNRSRKNRSNRKNRNRRGGGLFQTLYSPIHHLLEATGNTVSAVTNTTRNVARRTVRGVNSVGKSVTSHANMAVHDLVSRRRKSRRSSRR